MNEIIKEVKRLGTLAISHYLLQANMLPAIEFDTFNAFHYLIQIGAKLVIDLSPCSKNIPDTPISPGLLHPHQ